MPVIPAPAQFRVQNWTIKAAPGARRSAAEFWLSMSSIRMMNEILHELDLSHPFKFRDNRSMHGLALQTEGTYQGTPVQFRHEEPEALRIALNRSLLEPYLAPLLDKGGEDRVSLRVPSAQEHISFKASPNWLFFTVQQAEYTADPDLYLGILRFVLDTHLLEQDIRAPFEAVLNST